MATRVCFAPSRSNSHDSSTFAVVVEEVLDGSAAAGLSDHKHFPDAVQVLDASQDLLRSILVGEDEFGVQLSGPPSDLLLRTIKNKGNSQV